MAAVPGALKVTEQAATDDDNLAEERLSISELEADVAYFEARLALLEEGGVDSFHQAAQVRAYRSLGEVLTGLLERLRRDSTDQPLNSLDGIQLEEES